jgi:hypothetical protein
MAELSDLKNAANLACQILLPRSARHTNRQHTEILLQLLQQSTLISLFLSTLICLYQSYHAVLLTGSERNVHANRVPRSGFSLTFRFYFS